MEDADHIARLIASLEDPDKKKIRAAVDALVALAGSTPELRHEVAAAMARAAPEKRWPMAYVLAQIAPLDDPCFAALKDGLDTSDPDIRWAVVVLLVRLAQERGGDVAARLVALAESGTPTQRRMAVYALRDIGAPTNESQQALRNALGDADPLVRVAALTSLKIFPETARAAATEIFRLLDGDPDARVRAAAAMALAQSGGDSDAIRRALERAAQSGDPVVVKAAKAALEIVERAR